MPGGHAHVGRARGAGPADLPPDGPRIVGQQRVLVEQGDRVVPGHHEPRADGLVVLQERRLRQRLPGDQGQVVGGGVLIRGVQAVRVDRHGVVGLQVPRLGVDQRHAFTQRPGRLGQGDRSVVGRDRQQRGEQVGDLVGPAGDQPGYVRHGRGGLLAGHHRGIGVEQRDQGHRGEHLERAGRPVPAVRVLGREDLAGARVGDDERRRLDARQPRYLTRRVVHDHAAGRQLRPPDRLRDRAPGGRGRARRRRRGGGKEGTEEGGSRRGPREPRHARRP